MNTPPHRETAKIYRFPTRMRLATATPAQPARVEAARLYSMCDYGSGWYHDAAIQDELRPQKS